MAPNIERFYQEEYLAACKAFKSRDGMSTAQKCRALFNDKNCPAFIRVQAHQLHSMCTTDYVLALARLQNAKEILAAEDQEDSQVQAWIANTEVMVGQAQERRDAERAKRIEELMKPVNGKTPTKP